MLKYTTTPLAQELIDECKASKSKSLDLGNCGLKEFPMEVLELTWLEELNFLSAIFKENSLISCTSNTGDPNEFNSFPSLIKLKKLKVLRIGGYPGSKYIQPVYCRLDSLNFLEGLNLFTLNIFESNIADLTPIRKHTNIQALIISRNEVSDLKPISNLMNLEALDFSLNQISDLTPLNELKNLNNLDFRNNQVSVLNPISQLTNLDSLDFSSNQVSDLSPIRELKNLNSLDFYANQVSDLSPISGLKNLSSLDFYSNQVSDLSPISELKNLTGLVFYSNQVSDLSPIRELKNLTSLDFYSNQVSDLSPISKLKNLNSLNLGGNQVSDLRPIKQLKNLESLDLSGNQVSDLSPISELSNLSSLDFYSNQVSDLSPISRLKNLESLDFSYNQVSDLSSISELRKLNKLYLGGNQVSDLRPISELENLNRLDFRSNQVSDLSPIMELKNLNILDFGSNQVSDLSPISKLNNLNMLDLGGNQVSDLSPISKLKNLNSLGFGSNQVSNLSPISELKNLNNLYFRSNQVSDLSPISELKNLNSLNFYSNQVSDLSPIKTQIENENCRIDLNGNPLESPPWSVWELGRAAVLNWFVEHLEKNEPSEPWRRGRLLMLGNSTVGKTWLSRYLAASETKRKDTNKLMSNLVTTHGMQYHHWQPTDSNNQQLDLRIQDFGGQLIYHDCHQIFFGDGARYAVLWEKDDTRNDWVSKQLETGNGPIKAREFDRPVAYWLETIEYFTLQKLLKKPWRISFEITETDQLFRDFQSLGIADINEALGYKSRKRQGSRTGRMTVADDDSHQEEAGTDELNAVKIDTNLLAMIEEGGFNEHTLLEFLRDKIKTDSNDVAISVEKLYSTLKKQLFKDIKARIIQTKIDESGAPSEPKYKGSYQEQFPFVDGHNRVCFSGIRAKRKLEDSETDLADLFSHDSDSTWFVYEKLTLESLKKIPKQVLSIDYGAITNLLAENKQGNEKIANQITTDGFLKRMEDAGELLDINGEVFFDPAYLLNLIYVVLNRNLKFNKQPGIFTFKKAETAIIEEMKKEGIILSDSIGCTSKILGVMKHFKMIYEFNVPKSNETFYASVQNLYDPNNIGLQFEEDVIRNLKMIQARIEKDKKKWPVLFRFEIGGYIHPQTILSFFSAYSDLVKNASDQYDFFDPLADVDTVQLSRPSTNEPKASHEIMVDFDLKKNKIAVYASDKDKNLSFAREAMETIRALLKGRQKTLFVKINDHGFVPEGEVYRAAAVKTKGPTSFIYEGHQYFVKDFDKYLDLSKYQLPPRIFFSYAHADVAWANEFIDKLKIEQNEGNLELWWDKEIPPQDEWDKTIKEKLDSCDLVILMISDNALMSEYIRTVEIPEGLKNDRLTGFIVNPGDSWESVTDIVKIQKLFGGKAIGHRLERNRKENYLECIKELKRFGLIK